MLCEKCGKNNAEVHLVKIVNGERHDEYVCRECAKAMLPFDDAAKLMKMTFSLEGVMDLSEALKRILPMVPDMSQFAADGKCPYCGAPLEADLPGGEGSKLSEAKSGCDTVQAEAGTVDAEDELADLKNKLSVAVRDERYEDAADIRDRIIELEKNKSMKGE